MLRIPSLDLSFLLQTLQRPTDPLNASALEANRTRAISTFQILSEFCAKPLEISALQKTLGHCHLDCAVAPTCLFLAVESLRISSRLEDVSADEGGGFDFFVNDLQSRFECRGLGEFLVGGKCLGSGSLSGLQNGEEEC